MPKVTDLKKLEVMLFDGDYSDRNKALIELLENNSKEAKDIVKKGLREGDEELRYFLKKKLSGFRKDDHSEKIARTIKEKNQKINLDNLKKYLENEDPQKRLRAVQVAAKTGDSRSVPLLLNMVDVEEDDFVKATLAKNLGVFRDAGVIPVIAKYLNDPDARVRANAIEGLESIGSEKIIEYIAPMLRDRDNRVQANAAKAMSAFDKKEVAEIFEKMLQSPARWQKESAIYAMGEIKDEAYIEILKSFILKEEDDDLALAALKKLSIFNSNKLESIFVELYKNNKIFKSEKTKKYLETLMNVSVVSDEILDEKNKSSIPMGIKIGLAFLIVLLLSFVGFGIVKYNEMTKKSQTEEKQRIVKETKNTKQNPVNVVSKKEEEDKKNIKQEDIKISNKKEVKVVENKENIISTETESNKIDNKKNIQNSKQNSTEDSKNEDDFDLWAEVSEDNNVSLTDQNNNVIEDIKTSNPEKVKESEAVKEDKVKAVALTNQEEVAFENTSEVVIKENNEEVVKEESSTEKLNRLNSMLSDIQKLKDERTVSDNELNSLKEQKEDLGKKEIQKPIEEYKDEQPRRILILPAEINTVNNNLKIFSNGILYSLYHVLEPLGARIELVEPSEIISKIADNGYSINDILTNPILRRKIIHEFSADYILSVEFRESGSSFTGYWQKYIINDSISTAKANTGDDSYLIARLDPSVDVDDVNFYDDVEVDSRENIALPFYQRGVEYLGKDQYEKAFNELKMAYKIAGDSDKYPFEKSYKKSQDLYILALTRDEEELLNKVRFNMNINLLNARGEKVFEKKMAKTATDYDAFLEEIFKACKSNLKTNGQMYSDYNVINGHSKDFRAIVYFYRGLEYLYNEKPEIEDLLDYNKKNIRERYEKVKYELERSREISPDFSLVYLVEADVLIKQSKNIEAFKMLKRAMEKEPGRLSTKYRVALFEEKMGNTQAAMKLYREIADFKKVDTYNRIQTEAVLKVALEIFKEKEYQRCLERCEYGLNFMYSENLQFLKTLCEYELGNYTKAKEQLEILKHFKQDDVYVKYLEADILYKLNSRQLSLEKFKFVLEHYQNISKSVFGKMNVLNFKKTDVLFKIAKIYEGMLNKDLAASYYRQIIVLEPYTELADKVRTILENL